MRRTQINLEEEQYQLLTLEARRQNTSLSQIIRDAIETKLNKGQKRKSLGLLELVKHAAKEKTGRKSLSFSVAEHHDEYLYGKKSKEWAYIWKDKR